MLVIGLTLKTVESIFPWHFTASFNIKKDPHSIRVMSWNVEQFTILQYKTHPEIKQQMLDLINQYQPDIACFQEMVAGDNRKAINNLGDFQKRLQFLDYFYSYDTKMDYDADHHFGIIVFSKFPIINKQTITHFPNDYNSTFQYADIIVNNDTVRVVNIHLQTLRFTSNNLQYLDDPIKSDSDLSKSKSILKKLKTGFLKRAVQAQNIKSEIDKSIYPVIVCGDFNDVPNSYAYSLIGEGLQNAFVKKGFGFGRTFSGISPTLRIDNIFADKKFAIHQFTRIPKKLSDHFPVIADLSLDHQP